jgi:hypothetical protein
LLPFVPHSCPPALSAGRQGGLLSCLQESLLGGEEFEQLGFLLFGIRQFLAQEVVYVSRAGNSD